MVVEGQTLFSRAAPPSDSGAPVKQESRLLRMAKAASLEKDTSFIDKIASAPFKFFGWNRIVEPAMARLLERAGEFVPETVKAGVVLESEWLSVGVLMEEVEQLLKPFSTKFPVVINDRTVNAVPSANEGANDGDVACGALIGGKIHLIREWLEDRAAVVRTVWHELLLHFGLRRFKTKNQCIAKLVNLYLSDGCIIDKASECMK